MYEHFKIQVLRSDLDLMKSKIEGHKVIPIVLQNEDWVAEIEHDGKDWVYRLWQPKFGYKARNDGYLCYASSLNFLIASYTQLLLDLASSPKDIEHSALIEIIEDNNYGLHTKF